METGLKRVARLSARDLVPRQYYMLFLAFVFVTSLFSAYALIHPINEMDWIRTVQQIRNLWRGENPFCTPYCEFHDFDPDLTINEHFVSVKVYSPWVMFYFAPLAYATARTVIALSIASWVVIILDSGTPAALILIFHPAFWMLFASSNADFLISGIGLWLIYRGERGWRRGIALMLIGIKPQILPLFLILECLRVLWEHDWETIAVMAVMGCGSVVLYPDWLFETVPSLLGLIDNTSRELFSYPFSVFGAWGVWGAVGISAVILVIFARRLTEWRTLSVILGFVWAPHLSLYNYALLPLLFRKAAMWRILLYLGVSIAMLPIFFRDFHQHERIGIFLFLLFAALLSPPDPEQTEQAIARRHRQPIFPPARFLDRQSKKTVA